MQEYNLEGGIFGRTVKKTPAPAPTPAPTPEVKPEVEENIDVAHGKLVELANLFETNYSDIIDKTIFDLEPVTKFIFNNITPELEKSTVGYSLQQSYTKLLNKITEKLCDIKKRTTEGDKDIDFFSQGKSDFANTMQEKIDEINKMSSDAAIKKSLEDKKAKIAQGGSEYQILLDGKIQAAEADLSAKEAELTTAEEGVYGPAKKAAASARDAARETLKKLTEQLESFKEEKRVAELTRMHPRSPIERRGGSRRNNNNKSKRGKKGKRIKRTRKN